MKIQHFHIRWNYSLNWFHWDSLYKQRFTCLFSLFNGYGGQYTMGRGSIYPWYIDPPTHGISTPLPMVYRPPTLYNYWLLMQSTHDQVRIVMSRLKLKVNNCLLNNKEFFKLFNSIFSKIGYNCFIIFQDYLNIKILKYDEIFEFLNFIYFF